MTLVSAPEVLDSPTRKGTPISPQPPVTGKSPAGAGGPVHEGPLVADPIFPHRVLRARTTCGFRNP